MPYLDLPKEHRHFRALQRIGATGILRGEGRNVGWANQTWFRADDPLLAEEIYAKEIYAGDLGLGEGKVTVGKLITTLSNLGMYIPSPVEEWWEKLGLENYDPQRPLTRLEAAVVIDSVVSPFGMFGVDYDGNLR